MSESQSRNINIYQILSPICKKDNIYTNTGKNINILT